MLGKKQNILLDGYYMGNKTKLGLVFIVHRGREPVPHCGNVFPHKFLRKLTLPDDVVGRGIRVGKSPNQYYYVLSVKSG